MQPKRPRMVSSGRPRPGAHANCVLQVLPGRVGSASTGHRGLPQPVRERSGLMTPTLVNPRSLAGTHPVTVVLVLLGTLALGLLISSVYKWTHRGLSYS